DMSHLKAPIRLQTIYVASPKEGQEERAKTGAVAVDDIYFQYEKKVTPPSNVKITMAVNRGTAEVNGEEKTISPAPVIVNGSTMIPIHFFINHMGGRLSWNNQEKKATLIKDDHLIEMWLNKNEIVVDGKWVKSDVAPILIDNRTMLPLRFISESLGWKVGWDPATKSVMLE